jgi:hypothetical protein
VDFGSSARALRAALFALVCVGTGTELHRLANGSDPSWVGPALALPIVWLAAYGLARAQRSSLAITLALGLAQLGLHVELGWFCPKTMPGMPGYPMGSNHGTTAMVTAHVVAVLVSGWWIGRGEQSLFALGRSVALLIAPAADLLAGRLSAALTQVLPVPPTCRGFHATARRTTSPPEGPPPSPRVLRGPPALPVPRITRRFHLTTLM